MKIVGLIIAFVIVFSLMNFANNVFRAFEGHQKTAYFYVLFFGSSTVAALVVATVAYLRGRRFWLWFLISIPGTAPFTLIVLVVKKSLALI